MSSKRYEAKNYEFTLRLLDSGCLLSYYSGVLISFSQTEELVKALHDFQTTGQGLIAGHMRKAARRDGPKMVEVQAREYCVRGPAVRSEGIA